MTPAQALAVVDEMRQRSTMTGREHEALAKALNTLAQALAELNRFKEERVADTVGREKTEEKPRQKRGD